jgi:hypothetical protein
MEEKKREEIEEKENIEQPYLATINKLDLELCTVNQKLDLLIELNKSNLVICHKMSNHIDFIEMLYDAIKAPFHRLMNWISYYQPSFLSDSQKKVE